MKIKSLNHSKYQHQYHIEWGTKYRRKWLKDYVKKELYKSLYATEEKYPAIKIEKVNVEEDHLHMQIEIAPNIAVSEVVKRLKQYASVHIQKEFKFIREMYLEGNIWSVGYFSSTIGLNEEQIRKYIEWQGQEELPREVDQESFLFS